MFTNDIHVFQNTLKHAKVSHTQYHTISDLMKVLEREATERPTNVNIIAFSLI